MTALASHPLDPGQLDMLTLLADPYTPLGKCEWDAFRQACWLEACTAEGWVDMNRVRTHFFRDGAWTVNERSYSAKWGPACGKGPHGFLDKHDEVSLQISGEGSKGNSNKSSCMRKWRGWSS